MNKKILPFILLTALVLISLCVVPVTKTLNSTNYNVADIAWMLVCTAFVFLMTPALAFFYGGMVHRKNVLSTMMKSVVAAGIVSVLWVFFLYGMCFGKSIGGFIGNPFSHVLFQGVVDGSSSLEGGSNLSIPLPLFALYQLMFAIITPGLVVGAVAERIKFMSYSLFIVLFSVFIYAPLAHATWHPKGWLASLGVLDFAGGTVVHISAGCAALAGAMVLKRRISHIEQKEIPPANIPYVLIGTGLLWFGWIGFNGGSALGANTLAVLASLNTHVAAASAGLAWMFLDVAKGKKPSVLGFCIGAVVGLVAITPGSGFVSVIHSVFIGFITSIISNIAVHIKTKSKLDDTLDVFPCHGIGGMVGMLLTGVFASKSINPNGNDGLIYGNGSFFLIQTLALLAVSIYSFVVAWLIFKFINFILPIRVSHIEEELGLDSTQHNEKYLSGNAS